MDNPHILHHCASNLTLFMLRLQLPGDSTTPHIPPHIHKYHNNASLPPQLIEHHTPPNSTSRRPINCHTSHHWKRCSAIVVASSRTHPLPLQHVQHHITTSTTLAHPCCPQSTSTTHLRATHDTTHVSRASHQCSHVGTSLSL